MSIPKHLLETLRKETPGTGHVTHLNNAGASLLTYPVYETIRSYQAHELIRGGYETAIDHSGALEAVYDSIARLIGADRDEIALVENATYAWHQAIHGVPWQKQDNVVTSHTEYATNFISLLQIRERYGVEIRVAEAADDGSASPENIAGLVDDNTRMIVLTHIPTNSGLVNPAEEVGKIARDRDILYLLDACQSIGQYPLNVKKTGCDMLSATGRKYLRAPRGTGFLYVRKASIEKLNPMFLDLHGAEWTGRDSYNCRPDARRFENWESNKALLLGLGAAAEYAMAIGMENIWQRIQLLGETLREQLKNNVPGATVHDIGRVKGGLVSFTIADHDCEAIRSYLLDQQINTSVSHKSSTLLDMDRRNLDTVLRASVHYYNTSSELDKLTEALIRYKRV